jgi:hypothetical protein
MTSITAGMGSSMFGSLVEFDTLHSHAPKPPPISSRALELSLNTLFAAR